MVKYEKIGKGSDRMLVNPTVPELLRKSEKNRYSLVIATAKRARQISKGSTPMTSEKDTSPITLAANEIGEGKVKILDEEQWKDFEADTKAEEISQDVKTEEN